jgi:hypothetical protein
MNLLPLRWRTQLFFQCQKLHHKDCPWWEAKAFGLHFQPRYYSMQLKTSALTTGASERLVYSQWFHPSLGQQEIKNYHESRRCHWMDLILMITLICLNLWGAFACVLRVFCFASHDGYCVCCCCWRVHEEDLACRRRQRLGTRWQWNQCKGALIKMMMATMKRMMLDVSWLSLFSSGICLYTGLPNSAMSLNWSMAPKN